VVDGALCRLDGQVLHVLNLSVSGLFVASETPLPAGQVIELELALGGRPPFRVLGKVTWVNDPLSRRAPLLPRGFGVQITRIALPDKLAIVEALKAARAVDGRGEPRRTLRPR
jgi:hypothetical protein